MKIQIDSYNQGYVVTYTDSESEFKYVYKCTEEFKMLQDISKRFLKLDIKVVQR